MLEYYRLLRSILKDHPHLRKYVTRCRDCGIFIFIQPCNVRPVEKEDEHEPARKKRRQNLGCPFGCRVAHRKKSAAERVKKYYNTPAGKEKKRIQNAKRKEEADQNQATKESRPAEESRPTEGCHPVKPSDPSQAGQATARSEPVRASDPAQVSKSSTQGQAPPGGDPEAEGRRAKHDDIDPGIVAYGGMVASLIEGGPAEQSQPTKRRRPSKRNPPTTGDPSAKDGQPSDGGQPVKADDPAAVSQPTPANDVPSEAGDATTASQPTIGGQPASGKGPEAKPQEANSTHLEFDPVMVTYARLVTRLIEGRPVSRNEVIEMLERAVRQHRLGRERRIDYVLRSLKKQKPP